MKTPRFPFIVLALCLVLSALGAAQAVCALVDATRERRAAREAEYLARPELLHLHPSTQHHP